MKQNKDNSKKLIKVPKAALLSLVASKLKGKVLFPKKIEEAEKMLTHVRLVK